MKLYPFPKTRANGILFGLFFAALLLLCRDSLITSCVVGFTRSQLLVGLLLLMCAGVFLIGNRRQWKQILLDRRAGFFALSALFLLGVMALKGDWQMMYFSVLMCLFAGVLLSYFVTLEQVARYFVCTMLFLGIYSLLTTYGTRFLAERGLLPVPQLENAAGVALYNYGISFSGVTEYKNRAFSIFREPGVYQYFIMLALVLNNYLISWQKPWQMWTVNGIFAAMMVSTLATGGYVELAIFGLILFVDKKLYRNRYAVIAALTLVGAAAVVVIWAYLRQNMLWWEIYAMTVSKFAEGETSGSDRIQSIVLNLNCFLQNPVLGGTIRQVLHAIAHNTSSTTILFAVFGLVGGLYHLAGWLALVWQKGKPFVSLGLLLVMGMAFNTQNLIADVFFWLFPTMALVQWLGRWPGKEKT